MTTLTFLLLDGLVWWEKQETVPKETSHYYRPPPGPSAVETTAYAVLIYVLLNDVPRAKPAAMWLIKSRNSGGGYFSTQVCMVECYFFILR